MQTIVSAAPTAYIAGSTTRGLPMRDTEGRIVRWCHPAHRYRRSKRAEEALRAQRARAQPDHRDDPWPGLVRGSGRRTQLREPAHSGLHRHQLSRPWPKLGWPNFLHPDDVVPTVHAWTHAVATGQPHDVQYRLRRSDGVYRWFHVLGQPARDRKDAGLAGTAC